ncbi:hypothetical protein QFC20_006374 [Naganishia adeliensis]|uniref:Uncharacterized protein n=1 Tax=Naganishia adeliensis TaxID=92952 RepID=A0ACC2VCD2_9TREE|nr:hypothetical protein QFC20_006374 [Naganishia adeliensis]
MAEQQVQLTDLNFSQLQEVKRQLDEEVEHLTTSFGQLKQAQAKYRSCVNDIEEIKPTTAGNPLLVPLTSSLYVPGRISDPEHVSRKDAIEYYADKVTYVQKNLEKLQETIERKQDNLQSCVSVMQMKMQEERQAEQAQAGQ